MTDEFMHIEADVNSIEGLREVYKRAGAMLAARKLLCRYRQAKEMFPMIGPEGYAEDWLSQSIIGDPQFKELIFNYFIDMLRSSNRGGGGGN